MSKPVPDATHERRDSPRVPMRFHIRGTEGAGPFQEYEGDLSLWGAAVPTLPAASPRYEVRFRLPERELHVQAEPIQGSAPGRLQLRFVELDTTSELAIARFLHAHSATR
jgi:PilZ domain